MGRQELIVAERLKKIAELRKQKINPYTHKFDKKDSAAELQLTHKELKPEKKAKEKAQIAGRILIIRDMGKITFAVLQDYSGKIQLVLQEPDTSDKKIEFFKKYIDSGDFVGVKGEIFRTKRGELSILVKDIELLSKSIQPLPEKWHGLQDKEERYRKRYLDLVMNPEVKKVFEKRASIIQAIREFLDKKGFLEADTPGLQLLYGGANARPFETHLHALDIPLYLRISDELYLKRLIVGGFEKVYEIGKDFRNEGIDKTHNPEFTMIELYQAYADYNGMMELCEDLWNFVAEKILGTSVIEYQGTKIDLKKSWKRVSMLESIKKYADIDVEKMSEEELLEFSRAHKVKLKGNSRGMIIASLFEHFCEKELVQPTFVIDFPEETTPLCKEKRNDSGKTKLVERFEPYIFGMEVGNAYSELNDPLKQKELFEMQAAELQKGDAEAHPYDNDFVEALEVGMPPTGGLGIGIDRMVMLLTYSPSIRDVLLFPFMKPEKVEKKEGKKA